jgi:chromosome segregation protein
MHLKSLELSGFKSFAKKSVLEFNSPISAIVGPNGSGKSNIAEAFRFVLGEQSIKSMRGKRGEDLIFNGASEGGRANRAVVKVVFDNAKRLLPIDFDEVSIERQVHRDGVNEYLINGSQVRLRDVIELLASAHIGASGHHIISQGEADKILNANLRDRRSMIEDALGLKIYQYKKEESERKLEKTEENIKQVESLRREIAPHIKFLKKQVEKIEKGLEMKQQLIALYKEYFKREDLYLKHERKHINDARVKPEAELASLTEELGRLKKVIDAGAADTSRSPELIEIEGKLSHARSERDAATRELGKIEGEISYLKRSIEKRAEELNRDNSRTVYLREVEELYATVDHKLNEAEKAEPGMLAGLFQHVRELISGFIARHKSQDALAKTDDYEHELAVLGENKTSHERKLSDLKNEEHVLSGRYNSIKTEIEKSKDQNVEAERAILRIMSRQNELHSMLGSLSATEEKVSMEEQDMQRELHEAAMLVGREAVNYDHVVLDTIGEERQAQLERRRTVERIKIRLEEAGIGGSEDVMKEHKEAEERDAFLARELEDLHSSSDSLTALIEELNQKLDTEFKEGVHKINVQFHTLFGLMFGGGAASLKVVREKIRRRKLSDDLQGLGEDEGDLSGEALAESDELGDEGLDIEVSLPRKKIKGLTMLSGGERALTSIALLFAISQVNPPPFIILDETDAALDEANSRKYGDMVENLSKHSQLIVITHNRETMSRAGILYGITMGSDGISKLLSIAFDEAVQVAK